MTEIEGKKLYMKKISDDTFELYTKILLLKYLLILVHLQVLHLGGQVGLRFQIEEDPSDDGIVP